MNVRAALESYASLQTKLGLLQAENGYIELSAQVLTGMPRNSNKNSPVENIIQQSYFNLAEIKREIAMLSRDIAQVEELIKSKILNDNERFVLKSKYIDVLTWKDLQLAYEKEKNFSYSVHTLKNCRQDAIRKLQKWVDENLTR